MKSAIHRLTEDLTRITGPLFHETKDYQTILHACCLFFARVIQSTPDKGKEDKVVEEAFQHIKYNLNEFLKIEASIETQKEERAEMVAKGIEGFADLEPVGGHILSDVNFFPLQGPQPVIEPGSAADHPDNPNQNIAKTLKPWPETEDGCGEFGGPIAEGGEIEEIEGYKVTKGEFGTVIRLDDEYTPRESPYSEP